MTSSAAAAAFDCTAHAPADARAWGMQQCSDRMRASDAFVGSLELVISELVTNAVRARPSEIVVTLGFAGDRVRVGVRDDAPGRPTLLRVAPTDSHGRGLAIVTLLADEWGVVAAPPGKEVWAVLAVE